MNKRVEPILSPRYWEKRLRETTEENLHHAIFLCPLSQWLRIEEKHREILKTVVNDQDSILDIGCGWGRLLTLLPPTWNGNYLGIDISPHFIRKAREKHPERKFVVAELNNYLIHLGDHCHNTAICISMRPMITRNLGEDHWFSIDRQLHRICKRVVLLEYDEACNGFIE